MVTLVPSKAPNRKVNANHEKFPKNNKTVRLVTCDRKIPEALDVGGTQQQAGYSYAHAHILSAYAESCPVPVRHTETKGLYDLCSFHGRGHANQITCAENIGIIRKYNTSRVPHFRECHLCSLLISGLFRQSNLKWLKEKLKITLS